MLHIILKRKDSNNLGRTLQNVFQVATKHGYIKVQEDLIIPAGKLNEYAEDEVVILMTGHQGEPLEALQNMVKKPYNQIQIQKGEQYVTEKSKC